MAITWLGLSSGEINKRLACVKDAWDRAQGRYITTAVQRHTTNDVATLLVGAVAVVVGSALVILVGNVGGTVVGGALGSLAGGAGAVPGAAAGRAVGHALAMGLLNLLGVGLLIGFIASEVTTIGHHAYVAIDTAWNSADFGGILYESRIDFAARHFAESVGKFFGALVMALIIVLTRGKAEEKSKILNSKLMKMCDGLQIHIAKNLRPLEAKFNRGLARATVTEGLPATPEAAMKQAKAPAMKAFEGMPNFYRRRVSDLRGWLQANGFQQKAGVRKPGQAKADGTTATDFQSEIWMRQRKPGGEIECVRIDPHGHLPPKFRDGPIKVQQNPKTGEWSSERIAWGERPHYHLESIPAEKAQIYLTQYVPEAAMFESSGKNVGGMQAWHQEASKRAVQLYGEAGELAPLRNKFEMIHIPLLAD
jgi:hypothetical protein